VCSLHSQITNVNSLHLDIIFRAKVKFVFSRSAICIMPSFVHLSVMLCNAGSVFGVKSHIIVFLRWHFLYTCSDTFAVGCIVQPQHSKKPNHQNFHVWNSHGQHGQSRKHGYSRHSMCDGPVLQLYHTSYVVCSAFRVTDMLLVFEH